MTVDVLDVAADSDAEVCARSGVAGMGDSAPSEEPPTLPMFIEPVPMVRDDTGCGAAGVARAEEVDRLAAGVGVLLPAAVMGDRLCALLLATECTSLSHCAQ